MQAFRFSLERVLSWRRKQLDLEEARLEQLRALLASTELARTQALQGRVTEQVAVATAPTVLGQRVEGLESLRVWTLREEDRLTTRMSEISRAIEAQARNVAEARRRVRLVERLKERKLQAWQTEYDREIETLAGEFAVAQWRRAQQ